MRPILQSVSIMFGVVSAVGAVMLTPTSAAAVNGITYASAVSTISSERTHSAEALCPGTTRAIGGGAIFAGSSRIILESAFPREHSFVVSAAEPAGIDDGDWYVVALAICAPESSLPGLERSEFISRIDASTSKTASTSCSAGKTLIGIGGAVEGDSRSLGHLALTSLRTSSDLRTVTLQGGTAAGPSSAGNWVLHGVAICVDHVPGQQFVEAASALNATDRKSADALCPSGTKVHSLGFDFTARTGSLYATSLIPRNILSASGQQGTTVEGLEAGSGFVVSGADAAWLIRAQAICAR